MSKQALSRLRESLIGFIGCPVDVDANVGRKRVIPYEGILESIYPHIFVVRVKDGCEQEEERRLSFSYVDLFTGNVVIHLHKNGHTYQLSANRG